MHIVCTLFCYVMFIQIEHEIKMKIEIMFNRLKFVCLGLLSFNDNSK